MRKKDSAELKNLEDLERKNLEEFRRNRDKAEAEYQRMRRALLGKISDVHGPHDVKEKTIHALLNEYGLEAIINGLIQFSGLDAVRRAIQSKKKKPGRKRKAPTVTAAMYADFLWYYVIEMARKQDGGSVNAICQRIERLSRGKGKWTAQTWRNVYMRGKRLSLSSPADSEIGFLIDTFRKDIEPNPDFLGHYLSVFFS